MQHRSFREFSSSTENSRPRGIALVNGDDTESTDNLFPTEAISQQLPLLTAFPVDLLILLAPGFSRQLPLVLISSSHVRNCHRASLRNSQAPWCDMTLRFLSPAAISTAWINLSRSSTLEIYPVASVSSGLSTLSNPAYTPDPQLGYPSEITLSACRCPASVPSSSRSASSG